MFFSAALLMVLAAKISALALAFGICGVIVAVAFGITWGYNAYVCDGEDDKSANYRWMKKARKVCITWIFFGAFGILVNTLIPSTQEFLLLASFKGVDQYNSTHPNSMISVDGVVGTADNVMKVFTDSLQRVEDLVNPKPAAPQAQR